ncbi:extracellular solute-binding protein [Candidatus Venteria ishoeyi]|uniref:extracellular solute-binding protein n=1 Tax=Candidatus Venteria ishoeyi TaxID=1899563 RepID=UPI0025A56724|nr:extracellular solute-binding protein [Candidatus Venteria ishoeyi]MDM8545823.1 extracellular solute-binding protein [Candidatus Venteria ishoeyi]
MFKATFIILLLGLALFSKAWAVHGVALGAMPKYPAGFKHFDYVNPNAPKGGKITLSARGSFDSFNPYVLKGIAAEGSGLLVETLMATSQDEPFSMYGLLADDVELAGDQLSVTFHLNPAAKFANGKPVLAADVKFSFESLTGPQGHPHYQVYWRDISACEVLDDARVRFHFKQVNRELHMIIGQLPVFSRDWLMDKTLDKVTSSPIGSGPYLLLSHKTGKDVIYQRRDDYWGWHLNVNQGRFNFAQVHYKYYKDQEITLEALKAGDFDFLDISSSRQWARDLEGEKFERGKLIKTILPHKNNAGMQAFIFNLRKPLFQDIQVRRALNLAFDFEWTNQNLFFNQYTRCDSYFSNSELAASGLPDAEELQLLEPLRKHLPDAVFSKVWQPVTTAKPGSLRMNLRQAKKLLNAAGWKVTNGGQVLHNAQGKPFHFKIILMDKAFERIVAPFARNLKKLGIAVEYRTVDRALYKKHLDNFDYDMVVMSFPQSQSPGNEQANYWHSQAFARKGSNNYLGVKHPAIDQLVENLIEADSYDALRTASRALDRVLLQGDYLVPQWYINGHRVVYQNRFGRPRQLPLYYPNGEGVVRNTWWVQ